jgi:N-methylhydantoinase A/oxoprolinase/acetone carboxylase beta subunit
MTVRVGVDVGGTFTKAVAFDTATGTVVAEVVVPTTHADPQGVAVGVVDVVGRLAAQVGTERIGMVTHSTTQAVNALLEGDVATVGMIGMGRAPDLGKARRRTSLSRIDVTDGKALTAVSEFLDVTGGLDRTAAVDAVRRLQDAGAEAIAAAEAFAPDDLTNESIISEVAAAAGLPVTTSAELTGLYGLELRAVTAALNASILPIASRTAEFVRSGVAAAGVTGPVMVMRGDGGATDLAGFQRAPARTLYSGPAASVAGALRSGRIGDGVIVEVGGTSTNVAAVRRGRPALSYVQVGRHATAIRALDVRVVGVAGGSMLRVRRRAVYGVGPRSAHIAGCLYACFLREDDFDGATVDTISPRPGDPPDYVVLRLRDGRPVALTNTCAANALGVVASDDYAAGDPAAARAALAIVGHELRLPAEEVARRMLSASTQAVGDLVAAVMHDHHLKHPLVVAVGGGAGALGRAVAGAMGLEVRVPANAEVISAIGDALSLVRAERERTFHTPTPAETETLIGEVEEEAMRAGAGAAGLDTRVEHDPERGTVRVTVSGSVALMSGALPGRHPATPDEVARVAREHGYPDVSPAGHYWLARGGRRRSRLAVFDRYADLVIDIAGEALVDGTDIAAVIERHTRKMGPMNVQPDAWVISGPRFVQVPHPDPDAITRAAVEHASDDGATTVIIGRE